MTQLIIIVSVVVLFSWAFLLIILTVGLKMWTKRRLRRWKALERRWRQSVEGLVLDGEEFSPQRSADRRVVFSMLLRYLGMLRGREAEQIVEYLDEHGFLDDAIADLKARRQWRRAEGAQLLGQARSRKAVEPLVHALADSSADVRSVAARSLAAIRDPAAISALATVFSNPDRWTLTMAADDLMEMGSEAVPALLDMVATGQHNVAIAAVKILGEIRDPRATASVIQLLRDSENLNMRAQAAAALGKLGGVETARALELALADPHWQVCAQAAKALGRVGDPSSARLLARTIHDPNWWVRVNCAEALADLGAAGWQELRLLAASPDRFVREQCVGVMQLHGIPLEPRDEPPATVRSA